MTHDVDEAVYLGGRVVVLSARPGTVKRELVVDLPRARRQGMVAEPAFGILVSGLLGELGVDT